MKSAETCRIFVSTIHMISFYSCQFIQNVWLHWIANRFIFETEKHNGIAELLEILGRLVSTVQLVYHCACLHSVMWICCIAVRWLRWWNGPDSDNSRPGFDFCRIIGDVRKGTRPELLHCYRNVPCYIWAIQRGCTVLNWWKDLLPAKECMSLG